MYVSGVDDLLPILSYVIIRSGLPELVSEASVMEEFIRDGWVHTLLAHRGGPHEHDHMTIKFSEFR